MSRIGGGSPLHSFVTIQDRHLSISNIEELSDGVNDRQWVSNAGLRLRLAVFPAC